MHTEYAVVARSIPECWGEDFYEPSLVDGELAIMTLGQAKVLGQITPLLISSLASVTFCRIKLNTLSVRWSIGSC